MASRNGREDGHTQRGAAAQAKWAHRCESILMLPTCTPSTAKRSIMRGMTSRRGFLQAGSLAAILTGTVPAKHLRSIGVQLYTVRGVLPQKPAETLNAIHAIGYQEIEATYAGLDKIWPAIQASGLKPVSIHLDSTMVTKGNPDD